MPQKREDSAREWLSRARSSLDLAKVEKPPQTAWEDMCFNAHQAVEKALKGVHIFHGIDYEWTHDIRRLISRLRKNRVDVPLNLDRCEDLTVYAGEARYPGVGFVAAESDWREAIAMADDAVLWAESIINA